MVGWSNVIKTKKKNKNRYNDENSCSPLNQDQTLIFSFFLKIKPKIIRELKHNKGP